VHAYEIRPRNDKRGVDLISDALPFGRLWYGEPNAITNAIGYAKFFSRSHHVAQSSHPHRNLAKSTACGLRMSRDGLKMSLRRSLACNANYLIFGKEGSV
jgi:hypothetical protein